MLHAGFKSVFYIFLLLAFLFSRNDPRGGGAQAELEALPAILPLNNILKLIKFT